MILATLRRRFCRDAVDTLLSLLVLAAALACLPPLFRWALLNARFSADADACTALAHAGACWGVVGEKARLILLGRYPAAQDWRAILAAALILASWLGAAFGRLSGGVRMAVLGLAPLLATLLLAGGFAALPSVPSELWGGLPLTLLLTAGGMAGALPLGIAVAYGRRSRLPLLRALLTAYVELIRGIPLVAALFAAAYLVPLFFPDGVAVPMLGRVLLAILLFAAAYLSEIIRGGLQAFAHGQREAARALGFGPWQVERWIVLPQVLQAVAPSLANSAIALFKDTSLVTIVSLFELTGSLGLALAGDPQWRPFYLEAWLFLAVIYWSGCALLARIVAHPWHHAPSPRPLKQNRG